MSDRCQFIYDGRTGPRGRMCNRPEAEHTSEKMGSHVCPPKPGHVHHTFTREFRCPTCGTREVVA